MLSTPYQDSIRLLLDAVQLKLVSEQHTELAKKIYQHSHQSQELAILTMGLSLKYLTNKKVWSKDGSESFGEFVAKEFGISTKSAYNYINVFDVLCNRYNKSIEDAQEYKPQKLTRVIGDLQKKDDVELFEILEEVRTSPDWSYKQIMKERNIPIPPRVIFDRKANRYVITADAETTLYVEIKSKKGELKVVWSQADEPKYEESN